MTAGVFPELIRTIGAESRLGLIGGQAVGCRVKLRDELVDVKGPVGFPRQAEVSHAGSFQDVSPQG